MELARQSACTLGKSGIGDLISRDIQAFGHQPRLLSEEVYSRARDMVHDQPDADPKVILVRVAREFLMPPAKIRRRCGRIAQVIEQERSLLALRHRSAGLR